MRLKRLELKGFKSFAKETVLHFNEDITGVVGPNGAGKSNVVDALRWVLGEQKTTELRLDRMGDVIFNGTKDRRASSLSKVSVTFDNDKGLINSEYAELTLSRILYRSGESEYRINDVPCRLKDINAILMDTGIGSNSYAIIALGMVDDILSDKDRARRKMFEQAAGISKFKMRKKETLQKLDNATNDLDRVEDLLHEIQGNLKRLKKEAKRAEKYLKYKEDYKQLSIDFAKLKSRKWRDEYRKLKIQAESEQAKYESLSSKVQKLQSQIEEQKRLNLENETHVHSNQKLLTQLLNDIRSRENEREICKQRITYNQKSIRQLQEQLERNDERLVSLREAKKKLSDKIQVEAQLTSSLKEELAELKRQKDEIDTHYKDARTVRNQHFEQQQKWERELVDKEKEQAILQSQLQELERRILQLAQDKEERKQELELSRKEADRTRKEMEELETAFSQLKSSENERKAQVQKIQSEIEELQEQLHKVYRELDATRHDHDLTKSLVDNLEGFPESARFLKKSNKWNGNAPLFSDIIYCNEEVRVALENYLEPYLSYFIVENSQSAIQAIELLKASQKGKAHFFINSSQQNAQSYEAVPNASPALEKIEVDDVYYDLISSLLHNVYFIEDGTDPQHIVDRFPDIVLLSKDGSIVWRKSMITGGSTGLFEGKRIGRKKNLENLQKKLKKLTVTQHDLEKELSAKKSRLANIESADKSVEIDALESRIREKQTLAQKAELKAESLQEKDASSTQELKDLSEKQENNQAKLAKIKTSIQELSAQLAKVKQEAQEADLGFNQAAEKSSKISERFNEKQIETLRQENKYEQFQNELKYQDRQLDEILKQKEEKQKERQEASQELEKDQLKIIELEKELKEFYQVKKEKEEQLTEVEQVYFRARNQIAELEKEVGQLQQQQQKQQQFISQIKDTYNEVKLKLHGISERLNVEFNLSIEDVMDEEPSKEWTLEELEADLEKVRSRLSNFGEVNPMAVEAYHEMKERHDLINEQKNDILDAKIQLQKTIEEIETTATKRFLDAFGTIREHFIDVFRTLFTEDDTADLILEDPDDPLESGIEIIAKPKGKRPKSLSQLSGGEKTLTATALLFALYLLKPAPFCVFDEVDAPLDDANIAKFNKIVKRFSKDSQFIIVTHNKSTMAAVDVIYGVYMNEPGVSSVSPVDFRSLEHEGLLETVG